MNPLSFIGPVFDAAAKWLGFQSQVETEINTPAMQKNDLAKKQAEKIDEARAAIQKGNLEQIRKMASE